MSLKSKPPIRITNWDLKDGTFVFPKSTTYISNWAFQACTALTTITTPDRIRSIYYGAFQTCTALTTFNGSNGLKSIGDWVFEGCIALNAVNFTYHVTSIGKCAFSGCTSLTTTSFSDQLESIGPAAFHRCTSLKTFRIPNKVTSIEHLTFGGCTALTTVNFSNGLISIGENAFATCTSLTTANFPDSLQSIGYGAFSGCTSLKTANFSNRLRSIGENAFARCTGLTSINISTDITWIHPEAFQGCSNLTTIIIQTEDPVKFGRIRRLLPEELRSKATTPSLYNAQHWVLGKFNARTSFTLTLPTEISPTNFSCNAFTSELNFALKKALQNVPIPPSWNDLTDYNRALNDVLNHHLELHQVCVSLNHFKALINQCMPKNIGFFQSEDRTPQSDQNKATSELYKLTERLITVLSKPDAIPLSTEEKMLLLKRPVLMDRIPLVILEQMGIESEEQMQHEAEYAQVDSVEAVSCCTIS